MDIFLYSSFITWCIDSFKKNTGLISVFMIFTYFSIILSGDYSVFFIFLCIKKQFFIQLIIFTGIIYVHIIYQHFVVNGLNPINHL